MSASENRGGRDGRALRRALRREVPGTVGLLVDQQDFAAMRRYRSFAFDDHDSYLRQTDAVLAGLSRASLHTSVALFDPESFADFCRESGLDPDSPASRARFTANITSHGGVSVAHAGSTVRSLVPVLVDVSVRRATWEYATTVLADLGACADCGQDIAQAAFDHASRVLTDLLDRAGRGSHQLVCSVSVASEQLIAVLAAGDVGRRREGGPRTLALASAEVEFVTVLAVGIALAGPCGLVMRTAREKNPDRLCGWQLRNGSLAPLSAAEVFNAYCTDAETGEPIGPESGVDYRAGFELGPEETRFHH